MKNKLSLGKLAILAGVLFVGYSCILFVQNQLDEQNATQYSASVVEQFMDTTEDEDSHIESTAQGVTTVLIDEELYIGVLEIPSLNLVLPIQSEWSYEKLKNTPCVYINNPLIIAAHNYDAHFGRINQLVVGDQVSFTDVYYNTTYYRVEEVDMLDGTDVLEMVETEYDLTLFTCNYNNNTQRVVVRLSQIIM